jgi:hypothetical protein
MRIAVLLLPLLLSGCLTTPVLEKFPEVPAELLTACPDLKLVEPGTTKLSEVIGVVADNYGQYKECQIKVDTWIEWYNHQKVIFNSIK